MRKILIILFFVSLISSCTQQGTTADEIANSSNSESNSDKNSNEQDKNSTETDSNSSEQNKDNFSDNSNSDSTEQNKDNPDDNSNSDSTEQGKDNSGDSSNSDSTEQGKDNSGDSSNSDSTEQGKDSSAEQIVPISDIKFWLEYDKSEDCHLVLVSVGNSFTVDVTYNCPNGADPIFTVTSASNIRGNYRKISDGKGKLTIYGIAPQGYYSKIILKDTVSKVSSWLSVGCNLSKTTYDGTIEDIGIQESFNQNEYYLFNFTDEKPCFVYRLSLIKDKKYTFETTNSKSEILPSNRIDYDFGLYDKNDVKLISGNETFSFTPTETGDYYFVVYTSTPNTSGTAGVHVFSNTQ